MFDFQRKNQLDFGVVSVEDDRDIEVFRLKNESKRGLWTESVKLLRDIILIVAVLVLLGVFVAQPVVVEGTSMLPQLHDGERLLVDKLVYYKIKSFSWGHIERGDIIVFWYPKDPDKSYVKRVIGLPGESVEVRDGIVFVNGQELREPYLAPERNQSLPSFPLRKVEEHYYFVMGDNRDNSSDSRYWGTVPEKYIYGKAFFRYWNPSNIGFITHGKYNPEEIKLNDNRAESEEEER
ncbi:MAG TPA: signal peptidase I [Pyrinomonadaceae bacterium]|nr:signal peptidase I [Pyrinomonadaceae bacterium]